MVIVIPPPAFSCSDWLIYHLACYHTMNFTRVVHSLQIYVLSDNFPTKRAVYVSDSNLGNATTRYTLDVVEIMWRLFSPKVNLDTVVEKY